MSAAGRGPLAGRGIVVTRPAHQAAGFAARLAAAGARPLLLPTLEILPPADPQPLAALIDRLDDFDLAVFVSPNAARMALAAIRARRAWPAALAAAAIGSGGVRELESSGITGVIAPARFDSEGLLAEPALRAVAGRRIVVFRGEGGRELLGDTLRARGATVEYAACYRRARPRADVAPLLAAWARGEVDAVTVTSSEGLHNLCALLGAAGAPLLARTPLFVPHPRIERAARECGCAAVQLTAQGDDGLLAALVAWFGTAR